ncbi:hypothetical protein ES708_10131 [subsurface metagenome]
MGYWIGWAGVAFGLCVPIPQLIKIYKTRRLNDVALGTYAFLICCLTCYLVHAIYIKSIVFTCSQSVNLFTNSIIFGILLLNKYKGERWSRKHLKRLADWLPTKSQS